MKKSICLFLVLLIIFLGFHNIYAVDYNENILDRINNTENYALDLINKLTIWSNDHAYTIKDLVDKDLIDSLSIDNIILKLKESGYNDASNNLESIKDSLNADSDYIETTFRYIDNYLDNNLNIDNVDETDIFYTCRNVLKKIKTPLNNLIRIYYNLYSNDINNKIESFNNISELIDLYNNYFLDFFESNTGFSKIKAYLNKLKDLYDKYLYVYEPQIKDEFRSYYESLKKDYDKLYKKLESKLQNKLDDKINEITGDVSKSNIDEITKANDKLMEIMERIESVKDNVNNKFQKLDNYFSGIDIVLKYSSNYKEEILSRLTEAYDYTKSKLLDLGLVIKLKNEQDKKNIIIDTENELIIYNSKDLSINTLINKLLVNFGQLRESNTYSGKVGTKSKLLVNYNNKILKSFNIVVRGDIKPNGRIDITDLVKLCDKMYGLINLDNFEMIAADFDSNFKIDITDLVNLCDKIYE